MRTALLTLAAALSLAACGGSDDPATGDTTLGTTTPGADSLDPSSTAGTDTGATTAGEITATMRDSSGRDLGVVTLAETSGGITLTGRLTGLPPGEHGIHLHTTGRCDAPAFTSAGGHWNPTGRQHGTENPEGPHLGDLPNITVAADGSAEISVATTGGTLRGTNPLLDEDGATVMIHAGPDDNRTDPSGASGDRIACGVVSGANG